MRNLQPLDLYQQRHQLPARNLPAGGRRSTSSPEHPIIEGRMFRGARYSLVPLPACPVCHAGAAEMCWRGANDERRRVPHTERIPAGG